MSAASCVVLLAVVLAGCGWRTGVDEFQDGAPVRTDGGRLDGARPDGGRPDGRAPDCRTSAECADGIHCNGEERCAGGTCMAGVPVTCEDGVDCTRDECSEASLGCTHLPDSMLCPPGELCLPMGCESRRCTSDEECDDGVFCNGREACGRGSVCVGSMAVRCDDGDACTDDRCEEMLRACTSSATDRDRDGAPLCGGDCNDADPRVFPGARELCRDGLDNDCNGPADCMDPVCFGSPECGMTCTVPDADGDSFPSIPCGGEDCDDTNPAVNPFAFEQCNNAIDDDCNFAIDCMDGTCEGVPPCAMCMPVSRFERMCNDGRDDDCDGAFDCMDPDCRATPICSVPCAGIELGSAVGLAVATGSTVGLPDAQGGTCGGRGSPEAIYRWTAPSSGPFVFDTVGSGYDTMLYLRADSCTGPELGCNDDTPGGVQSQVTVRLVAGQVVFVFVDGFGMSSGSYVLNIRTMAGSEIGACFDRIDNDGDGAVDCADTDCTSEPGCCMGVAEVCDNMRDDDCDRLVDCADPNCVGTPFCVPPCLPFEICGNGVDDDCNMRTDCADLACAGTPGCPRLDAGTTRRDAGTPFDGGGVCTSGEIGIAACTNGRDEDCDGRADCADPDCSPFGPEGECCNGRDDNADMVVDEFTCRCSTSAECALVGSLDQVCWTSSYSVCAPRCNFYGGDVFCRNFFMDMPRCNAMTGECVP